jgi:prophage antirepressor-like protein
MTMQELKIFEEKQIRTVWDEVQEKWYFCINDIVAVLTDSKDPADYFKKVRKRDPELDSFVRGTICPSHQFVSTDGKRHSAKCMDLQSMLRLVQSIPSKKAEPIKRWLAEVGAERIKQMQDPNLVSALTGHVEGSRAFTRYRTIDIDMKKDLVKILEENSL